jgi:GAF domain-containing protein/HAMP domain-containing protein
MLLRFGELPFRIKVVGAFILVSAISVAAVAGLSVYLSIQSLNTASTLALSSAARSTANLVDNFFVVMRSRTYAEAQLPAVRAFMDLNRPTTPQRADFAATVTSLLSQPGYQIGSQANYIDYIRRYLLVDERGVVVFDSSDTSLGENVRQSAYFQPAMITDQPFASQVVFDSASGQASLFVAVRVTGATGALQGVLAIEIDPAVFQAILLDSNNQVGPDSFAILVDDDTGLRLAQGAAPSRLYRVLLPLDFSQFSTLQAEGSLPGGLLQDLASDETELGRLLVDNPGDVADLEFSRGLRSEGGAYFASVAALETRPWRMVYAQTQAAILAPIQTQIGSVIGLALIVALLAAGAALAIGQRLAEPVVTLKNLAQTIASGDLSVRAEVPVRDEIGALAESLNQMTDQLQQNIVDLERRVTERTSDLQRRSQQLQAAAEVGRLIATIRNQDELLNQSVQLISERFGFYHAGIFLLDQAGRFALLSAANSPGGQRMLARGHRLAVGQQGIVGFVTGTGKPRIALDVGHDAVFFNNPDLPQTRSEMALPLRSAGRILGALDVQSTEAQAFSEEDVSTLQVLADLLSVTLDNASLFRETENALSTMRRSFGAVSQKGWVERVAASTLHGASLGFVASERGAATFDQALSLHDAAGANLSLPITVREMVIGSVEIYRASADDTAPAFSQEDLEMLNTLVDQLGLALESARLYESSQLQAERDRLVSDVTARLQQNLDVDAVLRAAAQEIRQALDLHEVTIFMQPEASLPGDHSAEVTA